MKLLFLFLLFISIGILIVIFFKQYTISALQQPIQTPLSTVLPFSLAKPPPKSLRGYIASFSKKVQWQAREATGPATLLQKNTVLQGEEFWTNEDGEVTLQFPSMAKITVGPNTHISFIQTILETFVIRQDGGTVTYTNIGKHPITIRIPPLLIQQNSGEMLIEQDDVLSQIVLKINKGSATVGFNDSENISTVVTLKENNRYVFDIATRTGEKETL